MPYDIDVRTLLAFISTVATVVSCYFAWCRRRELRAFIKYVTAKDEGKS